MMKEYQIYIKMDAEDPEDFLNALFQMKDKEILQYITEVDE